MTTSTPLKVNEAVIEDELTHESPATVAAVAPTTAQAQHEWETFHVGHVVCDFLPTDTFTKLLKKWLSEDTLHHIVTLNPEMVIEAETNLKFREAVMAADIRVPDGAGLIWAQWYIRSEFWSLLPSLFAFSFRSVERITGIDTVYSLAALCAQQQEPLYLVGGTPYQVEKTALRLRQDFPGLQVHTSKPHTYTSNGPADIIADITARNARVILVAYGAPQQTLWIEAQRQHLPSVRIAVGVGGAFAILSEDKPRAPRWLRQLNLEWLWRLFLEPSRLPRIWRAIVQFPLLIKRQKHPST